MLLADTFLGYKDEKSWPIKPSLWLDIIQHDHGIVYLHENKAAVGALPSMTTLFLGIPSVPFSDCFVVAQLTA